MPRIVIGDGALYYERQGVGFPVLFVSGLTGFGSFWQDQVAAFAKTFDVITHDQRGIGQSDLTRSGFTVDRMAADVIGLMDALEIERAHIVGHSTGGAMAQILAIEHPKRLASVVLSASWTKPDAYLRRLFGLRISGAIQLDGKNLHARFGRSRAATLGLDGQIGQCSHAPGLGRDCLSRGHAHAVCPDLLGGENPNEFD